jgi:nucleotide-binding universal stress UspA family protein
MIRSVLFPIADAPLSLSAREHVFWLANLRPSRIHALAAIDIKAFELPVMGTPDGFMPSVVTPPLQESQNLLDELTDSAKKQLDQFAGDCVARGIHCSTEVRTGIPGEIIAREAVAHGLVVMSRTGYSRAPAVEEKVEPLVSHVIRGSIRPVLVSGREFARGSKIEHILVAFDGSTHAARALGVAVELGTGTEIQCILITVADSEESGQEILAPAEAFLRHHDVIPKKRVVIGSKPSEIICDLVSEEGADILIMGAYGHSPIREVIFGSTTERVLAHCGSTVVLQS